MKTNENEIHVYYFESYAQARLFLLKQLKIKYVINASIDKMGNSNQWKLEFQIPCEDFIKKYMKNYLTSEN